jgi:hypothetical protein
LRDSRRKPAGLGIGRAAALRNGEPGAAIAVVGDHAYFRGGEGVEDAVLACGSHACRAPGSAGEAHTIRPMGSELTCGDASRAHDASTAPLKAISVRPV